MLANAHKLNHREQFIITYYRWQCFHLQILAQATLSDSMREGNDFLQSEMSPIVNDARGLFMDAVEAANSGHLGMPMGCAEIGAALFGKLLRFDPENPTWINRDRFILSAGHGSIFLYVWLHLAGYDISLEDIKNFRKSGSITHGHPEFNKNLGIECTTGPLGQGVANAVGIVLSCKKQAAKFNTAKHKIFDNFIVCLCGDGCLQEGITAEACSLAGHWKLDRLILIFDSNNVTLDAALQKSQSEDIVKKFEAYGFEVEQTDGNNLNDFMATFNRVKFSRSRCPKLIIAKTTIGFGIDEIAGTNQAHGTAGIKFIDGAKRKMGISPTKFSVSEATKRFFSERKLECKKEHAAWLDMFNIWQKENPDLAEAFLKNDPTSTINILDSLEKSSKDKISTRIAAGEVLQTVAKYSESIVTGSADLFASAGNYISGGSDFSSENLQGRNIYFGIREHAMAAIMNGVAYDGIFRPSCSTFLVFSDYMRAAIRMAALAKLGQIFIFTHDSIAVGEDGPTHQPIETLTTLRCIPNLDVVRPADYEETVGAWKLAMANVNRPTALVLSRQELPNLGQIAVSLRRNGVQKGAYVAYAEKGKLERIVLASGSELHLAMQAAPLFEGTRVVSIPCMETFERQSNEYKRAILPQNCTKRIAIEAGIRVPWYKYVGLNGVAIGVDAFGYSGKPADLMNSFGITLENLKNVIHSLP
ncbi:MAG: transketolase [Puniceicoccales bacterium]|jgi:transketolase|nr:transketolase [Puniceicoccales bacterium]